MATERKGFRARSFLSVGGIIASGDEERRCYVSTLMLVLYLAALRRRAMYTVHHTGQ